MLPENERKALLRFAEFETELFDKKGDEELVMLQLAWFLYFKKKPDRWKRVMATASTLFDPEFKAPT